MNKENDYDIVLFGKFPQTHVSDSSLISKLNSLSTTNSNGYYEYGVCEYVKIIANPFYKDTYYLDNTLVECEYAWFIVEPIEWRVLETNGNKLTILSEYLLQAMAFDENNNDYYNSSIREWLNNDFYNKAFNNEEKNIIIINNTNVNNDKVWLLSKEEAKNTNYFKNDTERISEPTDYALATDAFFDSDNLAGSWWLRTPSPGCSGLEYGVWADGSVYEDDVSWTNSCARPSLIIEIK